jgi:hypothetical protein
MQRVIEPLLISAGTATTIITTLGTQLSHLQSIVAICVGLVTLVYTIMKVVQIYGELKSPYRRNRKHRYN